MTPIVKHNRVILIACFVMLSSLSHAGTFSYQPVGQLQAGTGQGRVDSAVYSPNMTFPLEGKGYANSQVYGPGGSQGPGGGQCASSNYTYPWRDNYCEIRGWTMPLCPAGKGHQGQDIRPETCANNTHWVTAAVAGSILSVSGTLISHMGDDGIRYRYFHGAGAIVSPGQRVTKGQRLTKVSNLHNGRPATTYHLHFDMKSDSRFIPTYTSLVKAYQRKVDEATIVRLYRAFFLRQPDQGGYQYWLGQYKNGVSYQTISNAFTASPEFTNRYGSTSNSQFVDRVYLNVLGRNPDAAGKNYWLNQLSRGMSRGQLMLQFSESPEFKNRTKTLVASFVH